MISHILQTYINGNMLFLMGYGGDSLLAAQGELIEPGQILYSCADLLRMSLQGLPVDHIHSIIQKMWVDLGL